MQKAVILFSIIAFTALFAQEQIPAGSVSGARMNLLGTLVQQKLSDTDTADTLDALQEAVHKDFIASARELANAEAPLPIETEQSIETAGKKLEADALAKFPRYTYSQLCEMAAEKYPLYQEGDRVTVYYRANPRATTKVSGVFRGVAGGNIRVNSRNIPLRDMNGLAINEGPDGEIAKFDVKLNTVYREEWMNEFDKENNLGREKFINDNRAAYESRQNAEDFLANERNGYTWHDNQWSSPEEIVTIVCEKAYNQYRLQQSTTRGLLQNAQVAAITAQNTMTAGAVMDGMFPSAEKILAQRMAKERQRREQMEQQAREEQLKLEREAEEARKAEINKQRDAERADQLAAEESARRLREEKAAAGNRLIKYIAGGLLALLLVGGLIAWLMQHREKDLDVSKFFEGKGKLQQDFWDAANADPDHFKYVAYLFPDVNSGRNALQQLSFITVDPNSGSLIAKRNDISCGVYQHQGRAVAFLGGIELNYARWREASMVWPELPMAEYFKVSAEPAVKLELPNMEELQKESGIEVESLGTEDVRGKNGEFNRIFRFRCPSREHALKFLEKFQVEEEGIIVSVETDDGVFNKDINGIYTE